MKNSQILKELSKYLTPFEVELLKFNNRIEGELNLCLTINNICHSYNSTQENEDKVCELLFHFARNYFNRNKKYYKEK